MARAIRFAMFLVGCGAVACGSSSSNSSGQSSGGSSGDTCQTFVACNYLSASDINGVLGTSFQAGVEQDMSTSSVLSSYACSFTSTDTQTNVTLNIQCDPLLTNGPQVYNGLASRTGSATIPISGLGNAAFWMPGEPDGGLGVTTEVRVYFGAHAEYSVSLYHSAAGAADQEAGATALAKMVAKKLML